MLILYGKRSAGAMSKDLGQEAGGFACGFPVPANSN
jgi:hypothetical protein